MTEFLRKAPFVRLTIPFASGLIFGFKIQIAQIFVCYLLLITFLIAFGLILNRKISTNIKYQWIFGMSIQLFFLFLGIYMAEFQHKKYKNQFLPVLNNVQVKLIINETPTEKSKTFNCLATIESFVLNDTLYETKTKLMLYVQRSGKSSLLRFGDLLDASLKISDIKTKKNSVNEFDYATYMFRKGVKYSGYLDSTSWKIIERDKIFLIKKYAIQCRDKLLKLLNNGGFKDDELAVLSALVIGYKGYLDKEVKTAYSATGVMHILAVSGMHVGLIYIVFIWCFSFLTKIKYGKIIRNLLCILVIWFYAIITGISPSVTRAAFMISLICIGQMADRKLNIYNSLSIAAFVLLIINPYDIMDVGFQLSFIAILGIITLYPILNNLVSSYSLINKLWSLIAVSLAAQIATYPVSIYYFHQFPNYFLISNLLVVPLATVVIYGALIMIALSGIHILFVFISKLLCYIVVSLNNTVYFIENLPFSIIAGIPLNIYELILCYLLTIFFFLFITKKKPVYLITMLSIILSFLWVGIINSLN